MQTWQHHIPPSAAQDASLPGTPGTQTLVAITCRAAALSLLLLNRQGNVLTHPWGMWADPASLTSRVSRESLRPCRQLIHKACTHLHTELKAQRGPLYVIYSLFSLTNIMSANASLLPFSLTHNYFPLKKRKNKQKSMFEIIFCDSPLGSGIPRNQYDPNFIVNV